MSRRRGSRRKSLLSKVDAFEREFLAAGTVYDFVRLSIRFDLSITHGPIPDKKNIRVRRDIRDEEYVLIDISEGGRGLYRRGDRYPWIYLPPKGVTVTQNTDKNI